MPTYIRKLVLERAETQALDKYVNCQDFYALSKLECNWPILSRELESLKGRNVESADSILKYICKTNGCSGKHRVFMSGMIAARGIIASYLGDSSRVRWSPRINTAFPPIILSFRTAAPFCCHRVLPVCYLMGDLTPVTCVRKLSVK